MKECKQCNQRFEVTENDLNFYEKISPIFNGKKYSIPEPTFCPNCRYLRRCANRNEWNLYERKCDGTGKKIISIYSDDKQLTVFSAEYWWSDKWNSIDYGRDFDFNRTFFEQFEELRKEVPRLCITNSDSENCDYTNQSQHNKDCYLVVASNYSEKCLYGNWFQKCKNSMDCYALEECQTCYECINGTKLNQCFFVRDSENCTDAWFSSDCKGCSNIFGCHGLRNKQYYIFNQPVSKEEWNEKVNQLILTSYIIQNMQKKSYEEELTKPHKYYRGKNNEGFTGDYTQNVKDTYNSFNCRHCWDVKHSQDAWEAKDCYDMTETLATEAGCELEGFIGLFSLFSSRSWDVNYSFYCDMCFNSSYLFGCIGLRHNKYCILNKQYTKKEYEELVPKIIEHMRRSGEWGEFFPIEISPYSYNETIAQDYFPLQKETIINKGWKWKDNMPFATNRGTIEWKMIPVKIQDVSNSIVQEILTCIECEKNYRIITQELKFYKVMGLPLPQKCFDCRRNNRLKLRNPRKLWKRNCNKCQKDIQTTYAPERPEQVYCEECYLKDVY